MVQVELTPGGSTRRVVFTNCLSYCDLALRTRLHESNAQIEAIRRGLHGVIPPGPLALYTPQQLEELVCGSVQVDVKLLRRMTTCVEGGGVGVGVRVGWGWGWGCASMLGAVVW